MYALASYQHYSIKLDMDHVTKIRKLVWEKDYDERMVLLDKFQDDLLLCMTEKSWVLDIFGRSFTLPVSCLTRDSYLVLSSRIAMLRVVILNVCSSTKFL